jgi:hypothetical protein
MARFLILETIPFEGRFKKIRADFVGTVDQAIGRVQRYRIYLADVYGEEQASKASFEIYVQDESVTDEEVFSRLERQA